MSGFRVAVSLLLASSALASLDSEGTRFNFAFVRNANPDITNQVLTATVLNGNNENVKFTLQYRPDSHKQTPPENITVVINPLSSEDIVVPSWYGFNYSSEGIQEEVYLGLSAFATLPVTVIANNYDSLTKQGDSYLVLPTAWASTYFTFSLPPAISTNTKRQFEQFFILPVDTEANVVVIEYAQAVSSFNFTVQPGASPTAYIGTRTSDRKPRTYKIQSTAPIQVVAGVTCAGQDANLCDHVVYMPQAPPTYDCFPSTIFNDNHFVNFVSSNQFFLDIPQKCTTAQQIGATVNSDTTTQVQVPIGKESPLYKVDKVVDSDKTVNFKAAGSHIHIARYFEGSSQNRKGAFLATVPSISQWHKDYSQFITKNANDTIEIYCTVSACISILIDSVKLKISSDATAMNIDGNTYYCIPFTVAEPGFHRIDLDVAKSGSYSYFVYGNNGDFTYGYEGGLNKPKVTFAPEITTLAPRTTPQVQTTAKPTGPVNPTSQVTTAPVKPTSQATTAPVKPTSQVTTAPVKPTSQATTAPVKPTSQSTPAPVNPTSQSTPAPVNPTSQSTPAPVNPTSQSTPAPVNPTSQSTPAPVNPTTQSTPAPVNPTSQSTPAPVNPTSQSTPAPVNPTTQSTPAPVNPTTQSTPAPVNPTSQSTPAPLNPTSQSTPAPVNPSSSVPVTNTVKPTTTPAKKTTTTVQPEQTTEAPPESTTKFATLPQFLSTVLSVIAFYVLI